MSFRESSRQNFASANTVEHINAGSLQRIADACELMAKSHAALINDRDYYKRRYEELGLALASRDNSIRSLKGSITKLRRRIADSEPQS